MKKALNIACVNNAAFVMNFSIQWLNDDTGLWETCGWNSGNYPIDQYRKSPDLASIGVPDDAVVRPVVHAMAGLSHEGSPFVRCAGGADTVTYIVAGTTLNFSVKVP